VESVRGEPYRSEPRQEWIYGKLMQLVGPGPAAFYKDACQLIAEPRHLESTTHLVSHLLREIESSLRDVLEPIVEEGKIKDGNENAHKEEIVAIIRYLDIPESEPISKAWLKLAEKGEAYPLHARAHRRDLSEPRALDQEFITFWGDMQTILKIVLDRFETHFASVFDVLDKMLANAKPTAADLETLRIHVPNNITTWSYFFRKLTNTEWLLPLKDAGFFSHPPEPRSDDGGKTVRYTMWPQSQYLARIASHDPDQVLMVILDLPETANPIVHADLTDAALAMPAGLAAEWAKKEAAWLDKRDSIDFLLPQKLGNLVGHLARGGQADVAVALARSLLGIIPPSHTGQQISVSEPRAKFDNWNYEQVLQAQLPSLVSASGESGLAMFCDLLESAVHFYLGGREPPEDYSHAWRPAIEESEQNVPSAPKELLVSAVRDAAVQIIKAESSRLLALADGLEKRKWFIFPRVVLHLLRVFPTGNDALIAIQLADKRKFDELTLWHEYSLLAKEHFGSLSPQDQSKILTWIDSGPDIEKMKTIEEKRTGNPPRKEQMERYADHWRLSHLAPIHASLQEEWKFRYSKLVAQFGEPEHPEYLVYSSGGVGPTSPKNAQELGSMSVPEMASFLKTWQPSGGILDHSPEGLGRVLSGLVTSDPERFSKEALMFQGLDPTYIRGLIGGFRDAVKNGHCFTWQGILKLCQWTVDQPRDISDRESSLESDTTWGPARQSVAGLLSAGFQRGPCELSYDLRKEAWNVLQPITEDPDPTPEREKSALDMGSLDPTNLSINSVRGEALHCVIRYALWVNRHLDENSTGERSRGCGLDKIPEARVVLDSHLDLGREPSLAIRVIYGQHFPQLLFLDKEWSSKRRLPEIFPSDKALQDLHDATWEAYVVYCHPYESVFEVLHDEYLAAVNRLGEAPSKWRYLGADPKERLAEHLMALYWHGKLDIGSPILARFFEKAPGAVRGHGLSFIGRSLLSMKEEIPATALERLKRLWEWRLDTATSAASSNNEELPFFGWWFASGKFDSNWGLKQLFLVFQNAGHTEADHQVINRLRDLTPQFPELTMDCLTLMCGSNDASLIFLAWRGQVHEILDAAIRSGNQRAHEKAVTLINRLTALGHTELRTLLGKNS
jgi:hypothetical protein